MATEMVCGNCQGRLMVEQTGVVVACPHCGAHLQIGDVPAAPPPAYFPQPGYSQPQFPQNYPPQNYPPQNHPPQNYQPQSFPPQNFQPPNYPIPNFSQPTPQFNTPQFPEPSPQPQAEPAPGGWTPQETPPSAPAPEIRHPETSKERPELPPIPAPPVMPREEPPPSPPKSPVVSDLALTVNFPAPDPTPVAAASQASVAQAPESEAWLPKIDLTMPEPIRSNPAAIEPIPAPLPEAPVVEPVSAETLVIPNVEAKLPASSLEASAAPALESSTTVIWNKAPSSNQLDIFQAPPASSTVPAAASPPSQQAATVPPDFSGFGGGSGFGSAAGSGGGGSPQSSVPSLDTTASSEQFVAEVSNAAKVKTEPAARTSEGAQSKGVPILLFVMVASYASAITIAFIFLWLKTLNGSTLDLPDRKPRIVKGPGGKEQVAISIYPDGPLPASHRLKLGESRQYGSLMVTPLKVTKEPLEFVYHNPANNIQRDPTSSPVLKLWIKFENVSTDQTFPALDDDLVYTRLRSDDRSNNYLCLERDRVLNGKKIRAYETSTDSDWLMKGQKLDTPLKPGDTWESYIPTNDDPAIDSLSGPIAWRFHFRKGYNRSTLRGVTTIVEVEFDASDIEAAT